MNLCPIETVDRPCDDGVFPCEEPSVTSDDGLVMVEFFLATTEFFLVTVDRPCEEVNPMDEAKMPDSL